MQPQPRDRKGKFLSLEQIRKGKVKNLQWIKLPEADLQGANLRGVDLRQSDLRGANLQRVNLRSADLRGADLRGANLQEADLYLANLRRANLRFANLRGANLREADLRFAYLHGANFQETSLSHYKIVPERGNFIGFKKGDMGKIIVLEIPSNAMRTSSLTKRECLTNEAKVIEIYDQDDKEKKYKEARSLHCKSFIYRIGMTVYAKSTKGIFFFITEQEAREYHH